MRIRSAIIGGVLWGAALLLSPMSVYESLFLFAPLVMLPLGLGLARPAPHGGRDAALYGLAVRFQPIAALMALIAMRLPPGLPAGLLALGWALCCGLIGLAGFVRLASTGARRWEETVLDAGLVYLPVGGLWLTASRLGLPLFGFGEPIVLLTAIHFHYAGFAACVLTGLAGRALAARNPSLPAAYRLAALGIMAGTPLVAAGLTFHRALELAGALSLTAGLCALSLLLFRQVLPATGSRLARGALAVSAGAVWFTMALATAYAYGRWSGRLILSLPEMALYHGAVNAFGFAFCGLLGFALGPPAPRAAPAGVPFSRLAGRGRMGPDFLEQTAAAAAGEPPLGLMDALDRYQGEGFDPAAVHPAIRRFWERTGEYLLTAVADWAPGFRLGGRLWHGIAARIGQLRLPVSGRPVRIVTRLLPLDEGLDGRAGARGCLRASADTGELIYAAAYSMHHSAATPYMNTAFPLPGGNLTSIHRMETLPAAGQFWQGMLLTTRGGAHTPGDEGVYFCTRLLPIRLPIDEAVTLWAEGDGPSAAVRARHEMWLFGVRFLTLHYVMAPVGLQPGAGRR